MNRKALTTFHPHRAARAVGGDAITGMRAANQLASGDRNRKCYDEADDAIISLREAERTAPQGVRKT